MSAKPAGESLENARKPHSIYARTAQYFGECFLYNSNSIGGQGQDYAKSKHHFHLLKVWLWERRLSQCSTISTWLRLGTLQQFA